VLEDKTIKELDEMIKDLCHPCSVDDDLIRIEAIEMITDIIRERKGKKPKWKEGYKRHETK
jgi:hypothetical protein